MMLGAQKRKPTADLQLKVTAFAKKFTIQPVTAFYVTDKITREKKEKIPPCHFFEPTDPNNAKYLMVQLLQDLCKNQEQEGLEDKDYFHPGWKCSLLKPMELLERDSDETDEYFQPDYAKKGPCISHTSIKKVLREHFGELIKVTKICLAHFVFERKESDRMWYLDGKKIREHSNPLPFALCVRKGMGTTYVYNIVVVLPPGKTAKNQAKKPRVFDMKQFYTYVLTGCENRMTKDVQSDVESSDECTAKRSLDMGTQLVPKGSKRDKEDDMVADSQPEDDETPKTSQEGKRKRESDDADQMAKPQIVKVGKDSIEVTPALKKAVQTALDSVISPSVPKLMRDLDSKGMEATVANSKFAQLLHAGADRVREQLNLAKKGIVQDKKPEKEQVAEKEQVVSKAVAVKPVSPIKKKKSKTSKTRFDPRDMIPSRWETMVCDDERDDIESKLHWLGRNLVYLAAKTNEQAEQIAELSNLLKVQGAQIELQDKQIKDLQQYKETAREDIEGICNKLEKIEDTTCVLEAIHKGMSRELAKCESNPNPFMLLPNNESDSDDKSSPSEDDNE
jgi:hypothetical protein